MKVSNNIAELLAERGLKQSDLAVMMGVAACHVNRITLGKIAPSLPTALKLSRALGVTIEDVFDLEPE